MKDIGTNTQINIDSQNLQKIEYFIAYNKHPVCIGLNLNKFYLSLK